MDHSAVHGRRIYLGILLALVGASRGFADGPHFEVTFDPKVRGEPYTGRVYVVTTQRTRQSPLDGASWFHTQPFFAQDVTDWAPGEVLRFDPDKCLGYPVDVDHLPAGIYRVQAVLDLNDWSHDVIQAPGNGVSEVVHLKHDPDRPAVVKLVINQTLPPLHPVDTDDIKYVRLKSGLLSKFHGRYVHLYAAVALPQAYGRDPQRRFPALYVVPGFGGTIRDQQVIQMMRDFADGAGLDAVVVYLDPDCPTGHHVFADSANNGPCGAALVTELIPYLEQRFRLIPEADARYVTGASSGGWSSLWLQITYPDTFGGVWSLSPDPVDFSAFQLLDIYDPNENAFVDPSGQPRLCSRAGAFGKALVLRDFCRLEEVLGRGGQFQSFDAVFSPRGPDGQPLRLWDRQTGRIDPQVAESWKKYDIRLVLESDWKTLGPRLRGKLHLFCGDEDDFFLERAFAKLANSLKRLGSDAYIEMVPGGRHGLTPDVWLRALEQMKERWTERYGAQVACGGAQPGSGARARVAGGVAGSPAGTARVGAAGVGLALGDGERAVDQALEDRVQPGLDGIQRGGAERGRRGVVAPAGQR
jgi:S-formylglutathione hydrolase FrmB